MVSQAMSEERAVRIALSDGTWARLVLAARSLGALLRDPDDTRQVFFVGIALNGPKLPHLIGRIAMDPRGLALLAERPGLDSTSVDWAHLRSLSADTLGGAYARYLDDNRLDPDLFQPPPGLPPSRSGSRSASARRTICGTSSRATRPTSPVSSRCRPLRTVSSRCRALRSSPSSARW